MRRATNSLVIAGAGIAILAGVAGLSVGRSGVEALQLATRYTARAAFILFLAPFLASTLRSLAPSPLTAAMMVERRGLGFAFAAAHGVHAVFILSYLRASGVAPSPIGLVMGGAAYLGLVVLVLTSTDEAVRRLGPQTWRRLHTAMVWYVWLVFMLTYASRLGEHSEYRIALGVGATAAVLRLSRAIPWRAAPREA